MEDEPGKAQSRWRWCLIPGAIAAIIVTAILGFAYSGDSCHPIRCKAAT
jgi:hypothetical protein